LQNSSEFVSDETNPIIIGGRPSFKCDIISPLIHCGYDDAIPAAAFDVINNNDNAANKDTESDKS